MTACPCASFIKHSEEKTSFVGGSAEKQHVKDIFSTKVAVKSEKCKSLSHSQITSG